MSDQEPIGRAENMKDVTDETVLGIIDPKKIPSGYGLVVLDPNKPEFLITNNTGDVRLFIDPKTREMSSMELKEVELGSGTFLSGLKDLPPEYEEGMKKANLPKKFHITSSPEGTQFVHGIGEGTSEKLPLEIVQRSTQVAYNGVANAHLALIKQASITQKPIFTSLNEILFIYTPVEGKVEVKAKITFLPPREFEKIEKDVKADNPIRYLEYDYYRFLIDNPDTFKNPIEWYREDYYLNGLKTAKAMFHDVKERIKNKEL